VYVLDRRRLDALGTAFVLPATGALLTAAAALGAETESAIFGGLLTIAFGFAIGVVGFVDARRFTAWAGGAIASVGALVIAADVAPEGSGDDVDLIGPGLVVLAFGLAVVGLAWFVHLLLERRPPHDTPDGAAPTASPAAPPPSAGTDPADEIQRADSAWAPSSSPPSSPPSGPWSGPSSP